MPDFTVDGPNKLFIEPAGTGDSEFDAGRDIYSAWKRWMVLSDNAKFEQAFLVEGGTPIGATGRFTGATLILTNGWKVRGADRDHQLLINGNLFSDDGIISSANPSFNVEVLVNLSSNAQGVASGSGLSTEQATQLARVHALLDVIEGTLDHQEVMRILLASASGKLSGAEGTTVSIRDSDDSKDRIIATVDANGNRTAVTLDPT